MTVVTGNEAEIIKRRILDAAAEAFMSQGFGVTTIDDVAERVDCHFDGVVSGSKGGSVHDGIPLDRAHDDVVPSPPSLRNGCNQALETGHGRRREVDVRWRGPKSVGECLPRAIE